MSHVSHVSYVSYVSHNAPVPLSLLSLCPYALRFCAFAGLILRIFLAERASRRHTRGAECVA